LPYPENVQARFTSITTRFTAQNVPKCVCGSAQDPAGELTPLPRSHSRIQGAGRGKQGGEGGGKGIGSGGKEGERRKRDGE